MEAKNGREKYWSELDQQGQIDRLRAIVKHLQIELRSLRPELEPLPLDKGKDEVYF